MQEITQKIIEGLGLEISRLGDKVIESNATIADLKRENQRLAEALANYTGENIDVWLKG